MCLRRNKNERMLPMKGNNILSLAVIITLPYRFLGQFATKSTPIQCLHFTRKNLLLAVGPYSS